MSESSKDNIDHLLTADAQQYIDDNGFTARVVQQLPKRGHSRILRPLIFCAAIGAGAAIAYFNNPSVVSIPAITVAKLNGVSEQVPGNASTIVALAAFLFSLWLYIRPQREI